MGKESDRGPTYLFQKGSLRPPFSHFSPAPSSHFVFRSFYIIVSLVIYRRKIADRPPFARRYIDTKSIMRFAPFFVAAVGFTSASAAVLEQRALLDLCANVVGQLNIRLPLIGLVTLGQVNICLCASALPLYIRTNIVGRAIVKLLGSEAAALAQLNALVNSQVSNFPYGPRLTPSYPLAWITR
jgi:hypothetical protein